MNTKSTFRADLRSYKYFKKKNIIFRISDLSGLSHQSGQTKLLRVMNMMNIIQNLLFLICYRCA